MSQRLNTFRTETLTAHVNWQTDEHANDGYSFVSIDLEFDVGKLSLCEHRFLELYNLLDVVARFLKEQAQSPKS